MDWVGFRLALIRAAIHALISDSTQPTERAPSAIGEGNSPAAIRLYSVLRLRPHRALTACRRIIFSGLSNALTPEIGQAHAVHLFPTCSKVEKPRKFWSLRRFCGRHGGPAALRQNASQCGARLGVIPFPAAGAKEARVVRLCNWLRLVS